MINIWKPCIWRGTIVISLCEVVWFILRLEVLGDWLVNFGCRVVVRLRCLLVNCLACRSLRGLASWLEAYEKVLCKNIIV